MAENADVFDLKDAGEPARQIAEEVGLSKSAMFCHLKARREYISGKGA